MWLGVLADLKQRRSIIGERLMDHSERNNRFVVQALPLYSAIERNFVLPSPLAFRPQQPFCASAFNAPTKLLANSGS